MLKVGLTGNIGMGKSMALGIFAELGAYTLNADEIVSELLSAPPVIERLKAVLGPEIIAADGTFDRKRVADMIFEDDDARKRVEAVLHPLVIDEIDSRTAASGANVAVVEVPMLFEGGHEHRFNRIITVYTEEGIALERLAADGMDRADAVRRLQCQMPIGHKVQKSHYNIDNNADISLTTVQVKQIYRALLAEAQSG